MQMREKNVVLMDGDRGTILCFAVLLEVFEATHVQRK